MSFEIQEALKWEKEICIGKLDLFKRIVTVNEIPGESTGLKFLVNFKRTKENDPIMEMKLIEGAKVLNDPVDIVLNFESGDGSREWRFSSSNGCNVKSLIKGYSCPRFYDVESFRKAHAMVKSKSITYTLTFNLVLKKLDALPKANNVHEKLYLDTELSDVKIICEDKIFHSHKNILRSVHVFPKNFNHQIYMSDLPVPFMVRIILLIKFTTMYLFSWLKILTVLQLFLTIKITGKFDG